LHAQQQAAGFAQQVVGFDQALNGTDIVQDPTTGQQYEAPYNAYDKGGPQGPGYYKDSPAGPQKLKIVTPGGERGPGRAMSGVPGPGPPLAEELLGPIVVAAPDELESLLPEVEVLIARGGTTVTAWMIAAAPRLRVIARSGVGFSEVDVDAAT